MEPNTTPQPATVQPQVQPTTQSPITSQNSPQASQFSPQTVNLTKAIGMTESGGKYNVGDNTGDGADSEGAYQMTPAFISEWAPKAGIQYQSGTALTPQQQDEVAETAVQTMSTSGDPAYPELGKLDEAQIASAWNTGSPDAYLDPEYGQNNTYGSIQNYVNKVASFYNQSTPSTQTASTPSTNTSGNQSDWLTALEGLGAGGLGWLLSNGKTVAGDAIKGTGATLGTAAGAVLGGGPEDVPADVAGGVIGENIGANVANDLGLGSTPISDTSGGSQTSDTQSTEEPNPVETELPSSMAASNAVKSAIEQTLGTTQSGRVFTGTSAGQDAIQTASQYGLVEPDEEGNLSFNSQKLQQLESAVEEGKDGVISSQTDENGNKVVGSPTSVANYAGSFIGNDKVNTKADRTKASKIVQDEIGSDSGGAGIGDSMNLEDMRAAQKTHYIAAKASYTNPKPNAEMLAHKALGHAYGRAIRDKISEEDKPIYDKLSKTSRDLTNVKQLKKKVEGKKAPKNKGIWESFLRQGSRVAEIYIGDKLGGPIGAIIGGLAGEHFNRQIEKKFGRNVFETKGVKAALDILHDTKPKEYENLIKALKKRGVKIPESKNPKSEKGKVQDVEKDENNMKKSGMKGLISLNR